MAAPLKSQEQSLASVGLNVIGGGFIHSKSRILYLYLILLCKGGTSIPPSKSFDTMPMLLSMTEELFFLIQDVLKPTTTKNMMPL